MGACRLRPVIPALKTLKQEVCIQCLHLSYSLKLLSQKEQRKNQGENNWAGYSFTHPPVRPSAGCSLVSWKSGLPQTTKAVIWSIWVWSAESRAGTQSKPVTTCQKHLSVSLETSFHHQQWGNLKPRQPLAKVSATRRHDPLPLFANRKLLENNFGFKMMGRDNKTSVQMSYLCLDLLAHAVI